MALEGDALPATMKTAMINARLAGEIMWPPGCIRKAVSWKELISTLKKRGRFFSSYCGNCLELSSPSQLSKYDRSVQNELEELEEILPM